MQQQPEKDPRAEALREAYQELRYEGPAPAWQPHSGGSMWWRAIAVAAVVLVTASASLWWMFAETLDTSVREPFTVAVATSGEGADPPVTSPESLRLEPAPTVRAEAPSAGSTAISTNTTLSTAGTAAPGRPDPGRSGSSSTALGQTGAATGTLEPSTQEPGTRATPADVTSEIEELRLELRQLRDRPRALPAAPSSLHFSMPRAPGGRMSTGAPPQAPASWKLLEGAARD